MTEEHHILARQVVINDRIRKEMGDLDALAASIREFGLIQPIVLTRELHLVAGGRRLTAIRTRINPDFSLRHGIEFVYRDEFDAVDKPVRLQAVELEENLRRKDFTWQEQIEGKARLLRLMQQIYGNIKMGPPSAQERTTGIPSGFGVNKLAAMLGESKAQTSTDLQLATVVATIPSLAKAKNKADATAQFKKLAATALAVKGGAPANLPTMKQAIQTVLQFKIIIDCNNEEHQKMLFERFTKEGIRCRLLIS
jgi:ParB family transcriptional regulator, chromosome partitioning protein